MVYIHHVFHPTDNEFLTSFTDYTTVQHMSIINIFLWSRNSSLLQHNYIWSHYIVWYIILLAKPFAYTVIHTRET